MFGKKNHNRWTPDEIKLLEKLLDEGRSYSEIVEVFHDKSQQYPGVFHSRTKESVRCKCQRSFQQNDSLHQKLLRSEARYRALLEVFREHIKIE